MERTPNGGLTYLEDKKEHKCYGYDFSGYYMNVLGNKQLGFKEVSVRKNYYNDEDGILLERTIGE